ncbi:MAG: hypothetical protein ACTSWZ_07395 [Candidatus Heimdallarchaeaceae archaeon]
MKKKYIVLLILLISMTVPVLAAETQYTITTLYFNIQSLNQVVVTLYGEADVTMTTGGATTTDINFTSSTGTTLWQNATVSGGSQQDETHPIIVIDNTGTTNVSQLNISINVSLNPPSPCTMALRYINQSGDGTSWSNTNDPDTYGADIGTTNITIATDWEPNPSDSSLDKWALWLYGNFSQCSTEDSQTTWLRIFAYFA